MEKLIKDIYPEQKYGLTLTSFLIAVFFAIITYLIKKDVPEGLSLELIFSTIFIVNPILIVLMVETLTKYFPNKSFYLINSILFNLILLLSIWFCLWLKTSPYKININEGLIMKLFIIYIFIMIIQTIVLLYFSKDHIKHFKHVQEKFYMKEEYWYYVINKNYIKILFTNKELRNELYKKDYFKTLTEDKTFWSTIHENVEIYKEIEKENCFEHDNINSQIINTYKDRGGLFIIRGLEKFPEWDMSFCHQTRRLLFSTESYFEIFNKAGIHSALTVLPQSTSPIRNGKQLSYFQDILEKGGYVGFIVYGDNNDSTNLDHYKDTLKNARRGAFQSKGYSINDDKICILLLKDIKISLNTAFLTLGDDTKGKKTISFDGLLDSERNPKVLITKPQDFTKTEIGQLVKLILNNYEDEKIIDQVLNNNVSSTSSLDDVFPPNIHHLNWLYKSEYITEGDLLYRKNEIIRNNSKKGVQHEEKNH